MKKLVILLNVLLFMSLISLAQPNSGRGQKMSAEERATMQTEQMKTVLDLDEQTEQVVKEINLDFATQHKELRASNSKGPEMREQMQALQEKRLAVLKEVLTEEQYNIYKEMHDKRHAERGRGKRINR